MFFGLLIAVNDCIGIGKKKIKKKNLNKEDVLPFWDTVQH